MSLFGQLLDALEEKERVFVAASGAGDVVLAGRIWFDVWAILGELQAGPLGRPGL
jgi:hypothetical protein